MQVNTICQSVVGKPGESQEVRLKMDPQTQDGVNGFDDWRFRVDPSSPNYGAFSQGSNYTVDINPA